MKTIFELNYKTSDGEWHGVLFASKENAIRCLENYYPIGTILKDRNKTIENSFIIERILF